MRKYLIACVIVIIGLEAIALCDEPKHQHLESQTDIGGVVGSGAMASGADRVRPGRGGLPRGGAAGRRRRADRDGAADQRRPDGGRLETVSHLLIRMCSPAVAEP